MHGCRIVSIALQGGGAFGAGGGGRPQPLPALRDDLQLFEGPPTAEGAPTWTIYDPVRNRYFRIGREAFALLSRWHFGEAAAVLNAVAAAAAGPVTPRQLGELVRFLRINSLVRGDDPESRESYLRQAEAARPPWARWLLRNYLFIRVPLVRPDRFLEATLPLVRPLFSRAFLIALLVLGALGIVLALRQWQDFTHTFGYFFSLEGLLWFGVALSAAKVLHELGHAYTAKRYGCRVPTMGVAFLVLWPVLYTDTSDAWRLVSRRRRLAIGIAGMATELGLALIATLLWSFLPDGPARSAAFALATVTWVATLLINISPFMRFDGYYVLADWLGVQNLQDRAFALARWRLRELLFGFGEPPPEAWPPRMQRILLIYAYSTWIYRLFLFIGIALLVYHMFFKLLGLFLFVVEIAWFIARPVWNELREWWRRRGAVRLNANLLATLAGLGGLVWLAVTPWHGWIGLPAVLRATDYATLYPPIPAQVAEVHVTEGAPVRAGDLMVVLRAPLLEHEIAQAERRAALLRLRIGRQAASLEDLENLRVLQQELATTLSALAGLAERRAALTVRAPIDGVVAGMAQALAPGLWVPETLALAQVVDPRRAVLQAYAEGGDLGRIVPGDPARFYPDDALRPAIEAVVADVAWVNARALDLPYVASIHGGDIAVERDAQGALVPVTAVYRIMLHPATPIPAPGQVVPGVVRVQGTARSFADRAWRAVAAVLIRESGF
jgi:putative peptide zinc metalloprotease protein